MLAPYINKYQVRVCTQLFIHIYSNKKINYVVEYYSNRAVTFAVDWMCYLTLKILFDM